MFIIGKLYDGLKTIEQFAKQDKHLVMFPEELPARLIKMFSFPGETVLDFWINGKK